MRKHSPGMLRWIGGFKLAKAVLLIAVSIGALSLIGHDAQQTVSSVVGKFKIDSGNRIFQAFAGKLREIFPKLPLVAVGTFFYAALFSVEGIGLILLKRWGEWLTVIVTGSFIPIEIFELAKHFSAVKVAVLIVNIAIAIYLIVRLKNQPGHRESKAD